MRAIMAASGPLPGRTLGRYRINEQLGAGGMGVVYRARDERLERDVALKVLTPGTLDDDSSRKRFRHEALALSRLNHPNIATVYDFDSDNGVDFLVTELVPGITLDEKLEAGPLSEKEVLPIAVQLAEGLEAAHREGIIHRDLKPGNLRLTPEGRLKILDFGLAKRVDPVDQVSVTQSMAEPAGAAGTLAYMAPEQLKGERVDTRTDLWGAGVVLYELATARRPFESRTATALAIEVFQRPAPSPQVLQPNLSPHLTAIILKCLERDPEKRYQSARELGDDLRGPAVAPAVAVAGRERPRKHVPWWGVTAAVIALIACAGIFLMFRTSRAQALTEGDTVVLADFVNTTGEGVFDETLKQGLAFQLAQSPYIELAPDDRIRQTLRLMNRPPEERVVGPVAREVCQRMNVKALLAGKIAAMGSHYVITVDALNCATGGAIAKEQVEATSKEGVLGALGKSATRLREKLGESLGSIQKLDKPFDEVTTSSLEALKQFSLGNETKAQGRNKEAIPYYQRAVELDPNFAVAHRLLGVVYGIVRESEKSRASLTRAFQLRDRVSERERLAISAYYYGAVTRELDKARESLEMHVRNYPRDPIPRGNLAGLLINVGDFEKAAESAREALELSPNVAVEHYQLAGAYLALNRMEDAKAVLEQQIARRVDNIATYRRLYVIAFLQGDAAAMQRQLEWARGKPDEHVMLSTQAGAAAYIGKLTESLQLQRRAADGARQRDSFEPAASYLAHGALVEAHVGECKQARQQMEAAIATQPTAVEDVAPLVFALCGDTPRALALANELTRRHPLATILNRVTLPEVRAIAEINRGNPGKAIETLRSAEPFERGRFGPTYVRGLAYMKAGRGKEAAAEFEKVLSRHGVNLLNIEVALSHLQLARARSLAGERENARKAYQDFFALWKDADPDIPILQQAKAEYAKLR